MGYQIASATFRKIKLDFAADLIVNWDGGMDAGHCIDLQIHSFPTLLISWTTVAPKQLLPRGIANEHRPGARWHFISVDDCRREDGEHVLGDLHVCFVVVLCISVCKKGMSLSLDGQLVAQRGGGLSILGNKAKGKDLQNTGEKEKAKTPFPVPVIFSFWCLLVSIKSKVENPNFQ